jgi:hypothetical protein
MDGPTLRAEWEALSATVAEEVATWREQHPRASLLEIEERVLAAMERLQAGSLRGLVQASPTADLAGTPLAERPRCPTCGGDLEPQGKQEREVLTPRQAAALRLRRSSASCTTCGSGLFPPR